MAQPVDPNDVLMTGENSFVRLSLDGGKTLSTRASPWRVLWCPAGAGHALFLQSPLIEGVQIFSDNVAVTRWLQRTIETYLFPAFADVAFGYRAHRAQLVRLRRSVHPHDGARDGQPADRRIQHVLPREVGAARDERAVRAR